MFECKPIFNSLLRSKAGAMMLLVQIAITVAIVSNASFIIYDRVQYLKQETGYPEESIFSFSITSFVEDFDQLQQIEIDESVLRGIPGVINAVNLSEIPLSGSGSASSIHTAPPPDTGRGVRAAYVLGDENSVDTLGVKIIAGRNFNQEDVVIQRSPDQVATVAIASKSFVEEMFPDGDGLGNTVFMGPYPVQIIGVVEKMMGPWLKDRKADNFIIFPMVVESTFQKMLVRTEPSERASVMKQVEALMLENNGDRVVSNVIGMDDDKALYNAGDMLMLRMLLVLIVVLVLITALGIYGLTMFNISKRTKQIGTRRALGARKSAIVRYFLIENSMVCSAGLLIGIVGAIYLGDALLKAYSLPALDIMYVVVTAIVVFCISVLSVIIPANRAANISPSIATRSV
uniref:ABC transporter permease n=1 Tax=Ningiella ruwaisensis TaxID=2364274 RepID=UPI0010A08EFD|nr:FtsX-like permease family protein [Ningiella ruwaisensis]